MKIFAYKNNLANDIQFLEYSYYRDYIQGIAIEVAKTADDEIVAMFSNLGNNLSISAIHTSTYKQLADSNIKKLDYILANLHDFNKRILINVVPPSIPPLSDDSIQQVSKIYSSYANKILTIADKFSALDILISSSSSQLVYFLLRQESKRKIGIEVSQENLNYIDTDFYIFNTMMFDINIIKQQLNKNKEVFVSILNSSDLDSVFKYYNKIKNDITYRKIFNEINFICNYPDIFSKLFQELDDSLARSDYYNFY